ncbi:hypothetical protein BD560DRAFT_325027 [Blakeslea trispora]|nr:hypothetical protein BD560DRAFT_325027 [Blakeslea trispora]
MQKEIEAVQKSWQEEQQRAIAKLQAEHEHALTTLQAEEQYLTETKSVREQQHTTYEETLKSKQETLDHMTAKYNDLEKEIQALRIDAEELRTLKIAYEKMMQVKDKEIKEAEERVDELMASASRQKNDEDRVRSIVTQHQKEIKVLQTQSQQMLDLKDKELEGFSYRLKTITTSQQKDMEKLNEEYRQKIAELTAECQKKEEVIKSKTLEIRYMSTDVETSENNLKDQGIKLQNLENDNNQLRQANKQYIEENEQMLR